MFITQWTVVTVIIMYSYFSVILLLSIAAVVISDSDMAQKCRHVSLRLKKCCKSEASKKPIPSEVMECHQISKPLPSCELDTCLAKKFGILANDGTMDKKLIAEAFNKHYDLDSAVRDTIIDKCINGDISKYGKEDFCELLKTRICIEMQLIENCPEWSNEGDCEGAQDDLTACVKGFQ